MFISKEFKFEAAHILPRHPGKCSRLHGHSWRLVVELTGPVQEESGFVMDFGDLKSVVQPIVDRFDHRFLNCFVKYPSSEHMAIHIAHLLRAQLNLEVVDRLVVKVSETQSTWAIWDSQLQDDMDIFDAKTLDSADDKEDAEWRSPVIEGVFDVPAAIASLEKLVPEMLEIVTRQMTRLEQLRLYVDTMDEDTEIPEALRKIKNEEEEKSLRAGVEANHAETGTSSEIQTTAVVDEVQKLQKGIQGWQEP